MLKLKHLEEKCDIYFLKKGLCVTNVSICQFSHPRKVTFSFKKMQQNMAKSYCIFLADIYRDHIVLMKVNLKINLGLKLHRQTGFVQRNVGKMASCTMILIM